MSKEFKIGLITIIVGALFYYGFNYLRGINVFSSSNRYYATYQNVTGLNISNPVYFNGLPIGKVSSFNIDQKKGFIVVSIDIDKNFFVYKDASATLINDGLFGTKAIILDVGRSSKLAVLGDTLASEIDGGLISQFEPVADNLNTTIIKLNTLLDGLNTTDIKGAVDALKSVIGVFSNKIEKLDIESPINNTNDLISSFKDRSNELEGVISSSKLLIDSLNALPFSHTLIKVSESLDHVNDFLLAIQSNNGTLGKVINNDSLYNNLNKLLIDIDELIIHFNNYPKDFMKPLGRKYNKLKGKPSKN